MTEIKESFFLGEKMRVVLWEGATDDVFVGDDAPAAARAHADRLRANGGPLFYDEEEGGELWGRAI